LPLDRRDWFIAASYKPGRVPVSPVEVSLLVLTGLAAAAGRLLVSRRGGWLALLSVTTVLAWCLSTDTDPWQALADGWPLAVATSLATAAASLALRRSGTAPALGIGCAAFPQRSPRSASP
jgi:hypothetical protein